MSLLHLSDVERVTIKQLTMVCQQIQALRIHAYEGEIYLTEVESCDGHMSMVVDTKGKPLMFRSKLAALKAFKGLDISTTLLIHQSAYMEMIGLPHSHVEPMMTALSNPDDSHLLM